MQAMHRHMMLVDDLNWACKRMKEKPDSWQMQI